jgi:hypothetical protein
MKLNRQVTLRRELLGAGASAAEADELAGLAQSLSVLKAAPGRNRAPQRFGLLPVSAMAVAVLLVGMAVVTFAQASLPGGWLYPVKRVSENAAVAVDPDYRATLMMRRADEVRQLVADGAKPGTVSATLGTYRTEAAAYKTENYPAFVYCRSNLQQAEKHAGVQEKRQIAAVLKTLGDID